MLRTSGRPGAKAYDPDKDSKETRKRLEHAHWTRCIRQPELEFDEIVRSRQVDSGVERLSFLPLSQSRWGLTRGVYEFDATLREALWNMGAEKLPLNAVKRLPEWGIFLRTGFAVDSMYSHGAFITTFDYRGEVCCVMSLVSSIGRPDADPSYAALVARLTETPISFQDAYATNATNSGGAGVLGLPKRHEIKSSATDAIAQKIWPLLFYLCSAEPDIHSPREPRLQPSRKKNNGPVRRWEVGARFGAAFREQLAHAEQQAGQGHGGDERHRPRVHVRRAHWHTVLSGPRDQERRREIRWFPPVIVNAEGEDLPVTIWRQR